MSLPEYRLTSLPIGGVAEVVSIDIKGDTRNRLLDLGLAPAARVEAVRRSPAGDPVAYKIREAIIALRSEESDRIRVRPVLS